jgi:hypothetical protein
MHSMLQRDALLKQRQRLCSARLPCGALTVALLESDDPIAEG